MKIKCECNNIRIDNYLSEHTPFSRSKIKKMLKEGYIFVNESKVTKPSLKLHLNDDIDLHEGYTKNTKIKPIEMPLDIVYEDNSYLVINKPKGIPVHPGKSNPISLMNGLVYYFKVNNIGVPGLVHRLDKDTSGLLVIAKNEEVHHILEQNIIEKKYMALVEGKILNDFTINTPIGNDPLNSVKMKVNGVNAKESLTSFKVIDTCEETTLLECTLHTGRMHQIRVHLSSIDHPLIEDPLYGNGSKGQYLCSYYLKLIHPITHHEMIHQIGIPNEFKDYKFHNKTQD